MTWESPFEQQSLCARRFTCPHTKSLFADAPRDDILQNPSLAGKKQKLKNGLIIIIAERLDALVAQDREPNARCGWFPVPPAPSDGDGALLVRSVPFPSRAILRSRKGRGVQAPWTDRPCVAPREVLLPRRRHHRLEKRTTHVQQDDCEWMMGSA